MKTTAKIIKMSANDLLDNFADVVDTTQDWKKESTVLEFDDATATVCGGEVTWLYIING